MNDFRILLEGVMGSIEVVNEKYPRNAPSIWELEIEATSDKSKLRKLRGKKESSKMGKERQSE
jgi:hypothetical protein